VPILCFGVVLSFELVTHLTEDYPSNDYSSAFLATVYLLPILLTLYYISVSQASNIFFKIPNVIITLAFLSSYVVLLLVFWLLPTFINYSKILANQLFIFKNFIAIGFYVALAMAIQRASKLQFP
jgi:hypothetical protein